VDFVVDLDQTLFPLLRSMQGLEGGERITLECPTWESLDSFCDRPIEELISEAIKPERAIEIGIYPGAREVLHRLHDSGKEILIATHRSREHRRATEDFLYAVDLPYPLQIGHDLQKTSYLRDGGTLIDDAPHLLWDAHQSGFRVATLLHSYNSAIVRQLQIPAEERWPLLQNHLF
jgi:hypothetical protein